MNEDNIVWLVTLHVPGRSVVGMDSEKIRGYWAKQIMAHCGHRTYMT